MKRNTIKANNKFKKREIINHSNEKEKSLYTNIQEGEELNTPISPVRKLLWSPRTRMLSDKKTNEMVMSPTKVRKDF